MTIEKQIWDILVVEQVNSKKYPSLNEIYNYFNGNLTQTQIIQAINKLEQGKFISSAGVSGYSFNTPDQEIPIAEYHRNDIGKAMRIVIKNIQSKVK